MSNWIKITLGILGTIFLGAIGSGLWERFLSGFVDSLVGLSIELVSSIFKSYKDGIYETASLGFHETHSLQLLLFVNILLPIAYIRLLQRHPENRKEEGEIDKKIGSFIKGRYGYTLIKILTLSVMISCLIIASKLSYTNRVVTYSTRSLDIVKPYIPESEYDTLVSYYYQVRNADDYSHFNEKIKKIAKDNSLRLPENAPLQ